MVEIRQSIIVPGAPGVPRVPVFPEPDDHNDNVEERNTDEGEDDKESVGDEGGAGEGNVVQNYV